MDNRPHMYHILHIITFPPSNKHCQKCEKYLNNQSVCHNNIHVLH